MGSLTGQTRRRENRSSGKRSIILAALLVLPCAGRAQTTAVTAALERAGLQQAPDFAERAARAPFAPRLVLGARTVALGMPGLAARSLEVFAWIRWPLERQRSRGLGETGPLATRRRELAEEAGRRARVVLERRARPRSGELRRDLDDELDRQEACAELAALDGEVCP
jgi:hypothetical protein